MQLLLCPSSVKQISENDFEGTECLSFAKILLKSPRYAQRGFF